MTTNLEPLADALRAFASASEHLLTVWEDAIRATRDDVNADDVRTLRAYPDHWSDFTEELASISEFVNSSLAWISDGNQ